MLKRALSRRRGFPALRQQWSRELQGIMQRAAGMHAAAASDAAAPLPGSAMWAAAGRRHTWAPGPQLQQPIASTSRPPHSQAHSALSRLMPSSAAPAATAADAAGLPLPAAAFGAALDAGSELPLSWLSHWRQLEARRAARRALIDSTRGRQQQRMRQVATLMAVGSAAAAAAAPRSVTLHSVEQPGLATDTVAASGGAAELPLISSRSSSLSSSMGSMSSVDLPSLQQLSEMDELTWLASHPPEGEEASSSRSSSGEGGGGSAGLHLWSLHHPHLLDQHPQQQQQRRDSANGGGSSGNSSSNPPADVGSDDGRLEGAVQLRVGSDVVQVRPLWIAVYQAHQGGPARLFETASPLLPDLVGRLSADVAPFCSVPRGLHFDAEKADAAGGAWRNYFVGVVGAVAPHEDDILWPNQVLHRDRVLFNVRNGFDVAKFLADPRREDVEQHRDNLVRLAAERRYRPGWCRHMLHLRWGEAALQQLDVAV